MKQKTHDCGCITTDYKSGIKFKKICARHNERGMAWIALQHDTGKKAKRYQDGDQRTIRKEGMF